MKQPVLVQVCWQGVVEGQFVCNIYKPILLITDHFLVLKNYVIFVSDSVIILVHLKSWIITGILFRKNEIFAIKI